MSMQKAKNRLKQMLVLVLAVLSIWGLIAAVGEVMNRQSEYIIYDIIGCDEDKCMIVEDDIRQILDKDFNDLLLGSQVSGVDFKSIEARLEAEPTIEEADVFMDSKSRIRVRVKPREAAIRILDKMGQSYYIDVNGFKFPLSSRYTPRVLVANGHIPAFDRPMSELEDGHIVRQLFELSRLLDRDLLLQSLVEQVYVDENNDLILIPKVGQHKVIFGRLDESSLERLENLKIFYKEVLMQAGWDKYSLLNIKFRDQVIASQ